MGAQVQGSTWMVAVLEAPKVLLAPVWIYTRNNEQVPSG